MIIENGLVRLEFSQDTGSLVQITDVRTGMDYLVDPAEGRLFRVFVPDAENWIDRYADSHTSGRPEINKDGESLLIRYPDLLVEDGSSSGIAAVVRVELPAGADEALFTLELQNASPYPVCEAIFPWIGGWHGYAGERGYLQVGTHWPLDPFTGLRKNDGWNILNFTRKTNIGFPHVNLPLCDVTNGSVGLAVNFYPQHIDLNFDMFVMDLNEWIGDVHPSFGWVHRPFLRQGERWTSGPVGIAPHAGDWHFAARKMRSWLAGWWRPPAPRAGLRAEIGFYNVYFRDFSGKHYRPMQDLPRIARYGLEHGVKNLLVWDMPFLGMYLRAGSAGMFEDAPERQAELRRGLAEVREMGVHVSPLINMRLGMQKHPFWDEHGEHWALRSMYGMPVPETLPLRRNTSMLINRHLDQGGARFCQAHPEFQAWALGNTRRVLEMGFDAIFIDQPFSEDYCFSETHGHRWGTAGHAGTLDWIPRAADIVHTHSPDSYVMGEVPDIWNTQFFDLWWFWDWSWLRPEIFRYVLPDSLQSWVIDAYDHQDQMARAFAMGFLLNLNVRSLEKTLEDVPAFADRVARLAQLRKKTYAFTLAGKFIDRDGLTLTADRDVTAAVYQVGTTHGMILGDGGRVLPGGGKVQLAFAPEIYDPRIHAGILAHYEDGSSQKVEPVSAAGQTTCEVYVPHQEAVVLELLLA